MLTCADTPNTVPPRISGVLASYQIIRRNGAVLTFEPSKIAQAMMKVFLVVHATTEFAHRTCSAWLQGMLRALLLSRISAPAIDGADEIGRPRYLASQQCQTKPHRFFGISKPDMRNAP